MTPTLLQDFLVEELKILFEGVRLLNGAGEKAPLNIYPQSLPAKKGKKDTDHFPYVIVSFDEVEDPNEVEAVSCKMNFIVGIYDLDENYQGYKDCLNIMTKMYQHFTINKIFNNEFEVEYPISYRVHDQDTYPYFFGGVFTSWNIGKTSITDTFC